MIRCHLALLWAVLALVSSPALAAAWDSSVLLKAGTLGMGPELDMRVPASPFGLRLDVDGFGIADHDVADARFDFSSTAYAYDTAMRLGGTARLLNGGLAADVYPFGNGLRLSAGLVLNGNQVTARGSLDGSLRVGNTTVSGALPGEIRSGAIFNFAAPTLGLGYTARLTRHLRVSVDAAAMYEGDPHLSYSLVGFPPLASIATDAAAERQRLQRQFDEPIFPVVMLGFGWDF